MSQLLIYEYAEGGISVILDGDSVWLSLSQIAELFNVQKPAISKHLKNIFNSGELERDTTVSKMEMVQQDCLWSNFHMLDTLERISPVANFATTANDGKNYQVEPLCLDRFNSSST